MNKAKTIVLLISMTSSLVYAETSSSAAPYVGVDLKNLPCNSNPKGYGPFDYSKRHLLKSYDLEIVESNHFTPKVENMIEGESGTLEGDIDYTLRAWPNHHRALMTAIRMQILSNKKVRPVKLMTPPECYLQRAIHFSPHDPAPYSLFGYYLVNVDEPEEAERYYKKAVTLAPNNSKINYSYADYLTNMKRYAEALEYAKKAYQLGKPPQTLKNKLIKLGAWND